MTVSSADSPKCEAASWSIAARDGAAISATALLLGVLLSTQLSPIVAGAGPPIFLFAITLVAWPTATIARARGHHGVVRAGLCGGGLAAPFALFALVSGAYAETAQSLGLGVAGGVLAWLVVKVQALVLAPAPERYRHTGRYVVAALLVVGVFACLAAIIAPRPQPESIRTVAAIEVSLRTPGDRADLLAMLNRHAAEAGLHVYDGSDEWIEFRKRTASPKEPPFAKSVGVKTIYVSVWRGKHSEILVDDGGHQSRPWLMFSRGEAPDLATATRTRLLSEIRARWPEARDVPVTPGGGLPLAQDLIWTGKAYVVKPERVSAYGSTQPAH